MKNPNGFAKVLVGVGALLWIAPLISMIIIITQNISHDRIQNIIVVLWALSTGIALIPLGLALFLGGLGILTLRNRKSIFAPAENNS